MNPSGPAAPAVDVDGLTAPWLSLALDRDVELRSCERIGTGQTAATYRLEIEAENLPRTLVAKVGAGDDAARQRVRKGLEAEVRFYADLAGTVSVRAPQCHFATSSDGGMHFTLLLEDLAPRVAGVQVDGCSAQQAVQAVRNLAGLHAPRWNDETLYDLDVFARPDADGAAFLGHIACSATEVFVERYAEGLSPDDVTTLRGAAEAVASWQLARPAPFGVLHGDYRLDNLMFDPAGQDVVAVDWQTMTVGLPARDVAYFLGNSVSTDVRREIEDDLIVRYHSDLVAQGVTEYDLQQCFDDYRFGQLQGPMITTIGAAYATAERSDAADAMFLAMARRCCAAIRDLRTLDLL